MKAKYNLVLIAALVTSFITAQSFYSKNSKSVKLSYGRFVRLRGQVAICGSPYFTASLFNTEIPALKGWGHYNWKISNAKDSAQFYFNQGINLYYAFHTIESIASFTKATKIDSNCAMAWYGKALAMGPTINYENGYRPPVGAYDAAIKSKVLSANCTPFEKALIGAIQHRYSTDTTANVHQLRVNYADAMSKVYTSYKISADAVTLYADALLLLHPWDLYDHQFKAKSWTPQIRSLLESAMRLSPSHPGANHYYIHTMEASGTPGLALRSAHVLDTLMPQVSHMVHMSSHIYIRTGYYAKGIESNNEAVAGYQGYLKQYSPVVNGSGLYQLHNIHLKINCAQMAGNYANARSASAELRPLTTDYLGIKDAFGNYVQYVYMEPVFTALRFGKWDDILKAQVPDTLVYATLLHHFAKGMAYCAKGMPAKASDELAKVDEKLIDKSLKAPMDNFSTAYDAAVVAQLLLKGNIAAAKKQYQTAIAILQQAVAAEDHVIYNEPRDWPLPVRVYLANVMIKAGQYGKAIPVLNKDLAINPNNGWALTGLQQCYKYTNNQAALAKINQQLTTAWKIKDIEIIQPVF